MLRSVGAFVPDAILGSIKSMISCLLVSVLN